MRAANVRELPLYGNLAVLGRASAAIRNAKQEMSNDKSSNDEDRQSALQTFLVIRAFRHSRFGI
jgi:hypothetical protein